jgi:hypothetical protein
MSSSKKINFAAGVFLSDAQKPIPSPPPYTLHTCTLYTYSRENWVGGGESEPERRLEEQQFTRLGRKYQHD